VVNSSGFSTQSNIILILIYNLFFTSCSSVLHNESMKGKIRIPEISDQLISDFIRILLLAYFYLLIVRSLEIYWVSKYHVVEGLAKYELTGLLADFLMINSVFALIFLIQLISGKTLRVFLNGLITSLIVMLCLFHIMILRYYIHSLKPLDQFLFTYSFREVFFTVTTSNASFVSVLLLIILILLIAILFPKLFKRIPIGIKTFRWIYLILLISILPGYFIIKTINEDYNDISRNVKINKSIFFYSRSYSYLFKRQRDLDMTSGDIRKFQTAFTGKEYISTEYPFLHTQNNNDVIGNFFARSDTLPNFVILITEGLGERFIHTFHGIELMPFLDSLSEQSLYWDRFLTTGERSFAVVPSITGSLPYGKTGFLFLDRLPKHITILSLLKRHGYQSHFFYGQGAWFHRKDRFFRTNDIDLIIDKSVFSSGYSKVMALENRFFWGYNDHDLFQQSIEILDTLPSGPRIDLYFTGSMHSPFPIDNPEYYNKKLDSISGASDISPNDRKFIEKYRLYLTSVLFFDDALKEFIEEYKERYDYRNTIFIITGDHPMTEIPIENSIRRYHVPLIIYSPLLKESKKIHSTGSHLDIYPTLLAFLNNNYNLKIPSAAADLGYCLDTMESFRNIHPVPLMNDNREIIDYIENGYFLSQDTRVYKVGDEFNLIKTANPDKISEMQDNLDAFRRVNLYACMNDRIIPDSIYFKDLCFKQITSVYKDTISISETDKYTRIFPGITTSDRHQLYYDFSYYVSFDPEHPVPLGVIQITNDAGSSIFWQSFRLVDLSKNTNNYPYKFHIKFDISHLKDSSFYIKSYFWNQKNGHIQIYNFEAHQYQLSDCY
jgi:phosphoglycerol transferase MdoB-like AlkP superfamily enzyme